LSTIYAYLIVRARQEELISSDDAVSLQIDSFVVKSERVHVDDTVNRLASYIDTSEKWSHLADGG